MIEVGSVVTLAAGGALMTVVEVAGGSARVVWLDDTAKPHELTVDVLALRPAVVSASMDGDL